MYVSDPNKLRYQFYASCVCWLMMSGCSSSSDQQELASRPSESTHYYDRQQSSTPDPIVAPYKQADSSNKFQIGKTQSNKQAPQLTPSNSEGLPFHTKPPATRSGKVREQMVSENESDHQTLFGSPPPRSSQPRQLSSQLPPATMAEPEMAMSAPDVEGLAMSPEPMDRSAASMVEDSPRAQTTLEVFYATDRRAVIGVSDVQWIKVHLGALIAFSVYFMTFAGVFLTSKKTFFGMASLAALALFLMLSQSASVQWQKLKRLAENGDPVYLAEIRPASEPGLDYGICQVTIPPNHQIGHLDSPSLFKLEFTENPQKHLMLQRVVRQPDQDLFFDDLRRSIDGTTNRQALVFIHGYNVSFENAVKRTAQIVYDLKFEGIPICYSWSSRGALGDYTKDMASADATVVALQTFLEETVYRTGGATIHLVAHSMGNRALLQALDRIAGGNRTAEPMFGQLVMAAPDVSDVEFKHRFVPSARKLATQLTLYASSRDRALLASTEIHGYNRAGLAGSNLIVMDGLDTIDVSEIDTSLIGHSYYGDHPELIQDLRALVELSQPASQREWLTRIFKPEGFEYYQFEQHRRAEAAGHDNPVHR